MVLIFFTSYCNFRMTIKMQANGKMARSVLIIMCAWQECSNCVNALKIPSMLEDSSVQGHPAFMDGQVYW